MLAVFYTGILYRARHRLLYSARHGFGTDCLAKRSQGNSVLGAAAISQNDRGKSVLFCQLPEPNTKLIR